jgi:hypothetical protein
MSGERGSSVIKIKKQAAKQTANRQSSTGTLCSI